MASSADCTTSDCSRIFLAYEPSLAGNAILLALFAIFVPITLVLGIKYKSYVFATVVATGLALEAMGYIGRVLLHSSPNSRGDFVVFLLGTTLGPTCICGAMFLIMPRLVAIYGEEFRSWRPVWYLFLFYVLTTLALVLELAGAVVSTVQDDPELIDTGVRILVVGLAVQVVALATFIAHAVMFAIALRTRRHDLDPKYAYVYNNGFFKTFMVVFSIATFLLVLRTAYRIVEVAEGFESSIAQDEVIFLVLDGAMVLVATILLLAFFPARAFGQSWSQTSARRLSQVHPQPLRPAPTYVPHTARQSPTYNRMSVKSTVTNNSPLKPHHQFPPTPHRNMVDSDALW
ncbi:RTA1 like protein-domain-containing protein [Biscogniauxia marginata]|nr:RTA1 like protein-domain-containing protein [Biscogniauxia marginata]